MLVQFSTSLLFYLFLHNYFNLCYYDIGSVINAGLTSIAGIYAIYYHFTYIKEFSYNQCEYDLFKSPSITWICLSFIAYLISDLISSYLRRGEKYYYLGDKDKKKEFAKTIDFSLILHHSLFIFYSVYVFYDWKKCIASSYLLVYEISTIPLCLRYMTQRGTTLNILSDVFFALSFFVFRIIFGMYIVYFSHIVHFNTPQDVILYSDYFVYYTVILSYMLNWWWFSSIIKIVYNKISPSINEKEMEKEMEKEK